MNQHVFVRLRPRERLRAAAFATAHDPALASRRVSASTAFATAHDAALASRRVSISAAIATTRDLAPSSTVVEFVLHIAIPSDRDRQLNPRILVSYDEETGLQGSYYNIICQL
jgi:hypothetical protein